jgi:DNA replication protein DnaC
MTQPQALLLETHLKKLRLPSILRQYRKLASQAAEGSLTHEQFLQLLIEQELQTREQNTLKQRLRQARFFGHASSQQANDPQTGSRCVSSQC